MEPESNENPGDITNVASASAVVEDPSAAVINDTTLVNETFPTETATELVRQRRLRTVKGVTNANAAHEASGPLGS